MNGSQSTVEQPDSNHRPSRQSKSEKRQALAENNSQNTKRSKTENGGRKHPIDCITLGSSGEEEEEDVKTIPDEMENRRDPNLPIDCITLSDSEDDKSVAVSVDLQMNGMETPGPLPTLDVKPEEEPIEPTPGPSMTPATTPSQASPQDEQQAIPIQTSPVSTPTKQQDENSEEPESVEKEIRKSTRTGKVKIDYNENRKKKMKSTTPEANGEIEGIDRGFRIPIGLRRTPHVIVANPFDTEDIEKPRRFLRDHVDIGDDFQVEVDPEPMERDPIRMSEEEDRDEMLWKNMKFGGEHEGIVDLEVDGERILFESTVHNVYWEAIWRQYEGHIPMEVALQHLMKNNYNIPKSLRTIDQTLKDLQQVFKPLCFAQAKLFYQLQGKQWPCMLEIQEKAMRNYHISEVYQYFWKFRRFYIRKEIRNEGFKKDDVGWENDIIGCNCHDPICEDLVFEPRYGCANCTKNLRANPIPTQDSLLCLICQTYKDLKNKLPSSKNVILNEDEMLMISQWDKKEQELKRHVTREEFEQLIQEEKNERWMRNEFTAEETAMLNLKDQPDQKVKSPVTDKKKLSQAQKQVDKLQPFVLPHFTKCNCTKAGIVSNRSPYFMKHFFSKKEINDYTDSLMKHNGDMDKVAKETGVELDILKRFVINLGDAVPDLIRLFTDEMLSEVKKPIPKPSASYLPPVLQSQKKGKDGKEPKIRQ